MSEEDAEHEKRTESEDADSEREPPPDNYKTLGQEEPEKPKDKIGGIKRRFKDATAAEWLIAAFTAVICFTTVTQCSVTSGELEQMGKQLTVMERSVSQTDTIINEGRSTQAEQRARFELETRAWVGVSEATFDSPLNFSEDNSVTLTITNYGNTPAQNVRTRVTTVLSADYPLRPDYLAPEIGEETSAPLVFQSTIIKISVPYDSSAYRTLKSLPGNAGKSFYIYVLATIEYVDVFGEARRTTFAGLRRETSQGGQDVIASPTRNEME